MKDLKKYSIIVSVWLNTLLELLISQFPSIMFKPDSIPDIITIPEIDVIEHLPSFFPWFWLVLIPIGIVMDIRDQNHVIDIRWNLSNRYRHTRTLRHSNNPNVILAASRMYMIYDINDKYSTFLKILFANNSHYHEVTGGVYNYIRRMYEDRVMLLLNHHAMLHRDHYHSYCVHQPNLWYDLTNGFVPAFLLVPAPNLYILYILRVVLNIRVETRGHELVTWPGNPLMVVIWGTLRDADPNPW